nr:MAG TPA: hypothetical protein [Caudoviricetes sp.]
MRGDRNIRHLQLLVDVDDTTCANFSWLPFVNEWCEGR